MANIDITKPLLECLKQFKGAPEGDTVKIRENALEEDLVLLAKKLLYGGYLMVGKQYRIDIQLVEFYYHEEKKNVENGIYDYIVYHRNGRYPGESVPPFPIMSIHAHTSGYDITFEDPDGKYRASALIRAFTVKDCYTNKYIRWNPKDKGVGIIDKSDEPLYDDRSQNLYFFLNGFEVNGNGNQIKWEPKEITANDPLPIYRGHRKNVFKQDENGIKIVDGNVSLDDKEWAFSKSKKTEIRHSRSKTKDSNSFSRKERYGIEHGEFI